VIGFGPVEHAVSSERKGAQRLSAVFHGLGRLIDLDGRKPLVFALFMCGGAATYFTLAFEPDLTVVIVLFLLALGIWRVCASRSGFVLTGLMLLGIVTGLLAGKLATVRVAHPTLQSALGPVMIEGWVEEVEPGGKGPRLRLLVHAIDGLDASQAPRHVRVTHRLSLEVEAGRFVRCWVVLRPPPAPVMRGDYTFDRQAWYEGLGAVGYVQGRCRGGTLGLPERQLDRLSLSIAKMRRQLAHYVYGAAGARAGGFAAAVSSGDRSFMAEADKEALRGSGLAHLLAISGLHMGIIGGLIYVMVWRGLALIEPLALRIAVRKPAAIAALSMSFVYLILSGASVSTQRAFIMALVFFGAIIFDRAALSLRSLAIAMIIVVVLAPWSVLTPGFQMSFAATGVLVMTYEVWQRRRREEGRGLNGGAWFWTKSIVVTSLVTSLATVPFALYHFDRMAPLGLIANVFAMPIVSLISAPLAGLALVAAPFGLADWPLRLFGWSLEAILWIAEVFSDADAVSGSVGKQMPEAALVLLSLALILGIIARGWRARAALGGGLIGLGCLVWWFSPGVILHWAPSGEVFLIGGREGPQRIAFADGVGLAPLRYSEAPVTGDCTQKMCRISHLGYEIVLIGEGQIRECSQIADADLVLWDDQAAQSACRVQSVTFQKALQTNGLSLRHGKTGLIELKKPDCRARPWRTCPDPDYAS
jgi:competence protein ComEC